MPEKKRNSASVQFGGASLMCMTSTICRFSIRTRALPSARTACGRSTVFSDEHDAAAAKSEKKAFADQLDEMLEKNKPHIIKQYLMSKVLKR